MNAQEVVAEAALKQQQQQQQHAENGSGDTAPSPTPLLDIDKTNLIINYLPQSTTIHDLNMLFKLAGELESVKIMRHPRTGYSYGYGFVKYTTEEAASKAIELFNRLPFRNKILKVSYSRPSSQVTKNANLYISNLPRFFSEEQLLALFGQYGEIIQNRLLRDKATGYPRGVAFVRYARAEHAQTAINQLNGVKLTNCQYPLRVRIADDYSQQRANLYFDMAHCEPMPRGCGVGGSGGGGGGGGGANNAGGPLPPFQYLNRTFAQMSMRNGGGGGGGGHLPAHYHHHRFMNGGGGGDFDMPLLKGPW